MVVAPDSTPFAIHPIKDQYGRILGFTHEGKPADGLFSCTAEYVFIDGRQATEAQLKNYQAIARTSKWEILKTPEGTAQYNYKDKHGIICFTTVEMPNTQEPLIVLNGAEIRLPVEIKTLDNETLARLLDIHPDDIESITVLKDGAATAIYGDKGTNGVIEIKVSEEGMTRLLTDKLPGTAKQDDGSITLDGKKVKRILVEDKEVYNHDDPASASEATNADEQP